MPAPLPDLTRDQQCHYYQAPTGQRCGSPALKNEYYCYHHHLKHAKRAQQRVLIDPEVTRMELPPIEDRTSIFVALAAVVHRLAENTIDTRRAGQMIYGLQVALQVLQPAPAAPSQPAAQSAPASQSQRAQTHSAAGSATIDNTDAAASPSGETPAAPATISIRKQDLLYFLRSRHCATCNAELFPANELTERPHPGAPPAVIEEALPALAAPEIPAPNELPEQTSAEVSADVSEDVSELDGSGTALTLQAVAEETRQACRALRQRRRRFPSGMTRQKARQLQGFFAAALCAFAQNDGILWGYDVAARVNACPSSDDSGL